MLLGSFIPPRTISDAYLSCWKQMSKPILTLLHLVVSSQKCEGQGVWVRSSLIRTEIKFSGCRAESTLIFTFLQIQIWGLIPKCLHGPLHSYLVAMSFRSSIRNFWRNKLSLTSFTFSFLQIYSISPCSYIMSKTWIVMPTSQAFHHSWNYMPLFFTDSLKIAWRTVRWYNFFNTFNLY